ncbi:MAG: C10 family peptidase, partial [Armatimonadetes bacterium]|nr:C10 family peptidase [Armatimonadota bacterium]
NRATRSGEDGIYGPLITDEWDQIPPYNRFGDDWPSDVPAGCVATAMGMIIHYLQHPPRAFVENTVSVCGASAPGKFDDTFNYALMPRRLDASSSPAQVQEVANLLRACGIAAGMDYCFGNSEATHAYARWSYTDFFDYDTALFVKPEWCDWLALVKSETASGYPVQMGISSVAHGFGHSVVCDGSRAVGSTEYVHLNMGWSGVGNTWYQVLQGDTGAEWLLLDLICGIRPPGPQRVATPNLAPDNGYSGQPVLVTVSCPTTGAVMHYDTAGNWDETPTQDDQVIASGASILVDKALELKVRAWKPGWIPSDITRARYLIAGKVATPSFNPDGGVFYVSKTVAITCATEGATIHYTTNGNDPTEASTAIASGGSVTVNKTTKLKAKAWKSGVAASDVKSATYTLKVATPAFSPPGGAILEPKSVTVTCSTPGAVIRYTTNDKDPVVTDPKITSGATVRIAAATVLKAKAWKTDWSASDVSRAAYTLRQTMLIYVDKRATGPTHDGQTWPTAFTGIQEALNAADVGDEVWVAEGTYDEAIVLKPGVALYGGFAGTELSRIRRDPRSSITIIRPVWDGDSERNAAVRILPGADAMTRIDGFVITGRDALDSDVGCGISCDSG